MSASGSEAGRHARSASSSLMQIFPLLLLAEIVIDIFGLPFDEILIPAEAVLDIGILALSGIASLADRASGGRLIGSGSSLRKNPRGMARVSGFGAVVIYWGIVVALFIFQGWFATREPILFLLFGIFLLGFDLMLLLVGLLLTLSLIHGQKNESGRQVGSGNG